MSLSNLADVLEKLNLTPTQVSMNARFIRLLFRLSLGQLSPQLITQQLSQFVQGKQVVALQQRIQQIMIQWKQHQRWYRRYLRSKKKFIRQVLCTKPMEPYTIRCRPLAIIITLTEADYLGCTENYDSNGITLHRFGLIFIVIHTGGQAHSRTPAKVSHTLRHELGHAIFDLYHHCQPVRFFSKIAPTVRRAGNNRARHQQFATVMQHEHSHDSAGEFFCYTANNQFKVQLEAVTKDSWRARLKELNVALCELPNSSFVQKRRLYHIYLKEYFHYLHTIYQYQCFIFWLRQRYGTTAKANASILAVVILTPFTALQPLLFPKYHTRLKHSVRLAVKATDIYFQAKPIAWQAQRLLKQHHNQPRPNLVFPLVQQLTWEDKASWNFLRTIFWHYNKNLKLPGSAYIPLVHYVIWYCPVAAIQYDALLVLLYLIEDKKLSPTEIQTSQNYCRELSSKLPSGHFLRLKIQNLIL